MSLYDLIVIGAGPGGYEAAALAGKSGLKVLLVEKALLGGTCLNRGCIPTKTILASVHLLQKFKKANLFNLKTESPSLDYPKLLERKNRLLLRLRKGIENLLKESKVEVLIGDAEIYPGKKIIVQGKEYQAKNIILATGTEPGDLQIIKADNQKILNSTQILEMSELPKNILIVGAGAIGLEFADIFSSLGLKVTIADVLERILPSEDAEAVSLISKHLAAKEVEFILGEEAKKIQFSNYEKTLIAVGRKINSEFIKDPEIKLGLKKEVLVNKYLETSVKGIYAIGDLNNLALYAHAATYQGLQVVRNICHKKPKPVELGLVPKVIFTSPQLASVGKTSGDNLDVKKYPLLMLGKAQAENQTEGFLKLFVNQDSQVLEGAVIVAENADALIGEAIVLINKKVKIEELADMIHPHPTYAEIFTEILKE